MIEQKYKGTIIDLKGVMYDDGAKQPDGSIPKIARPGSKEFLDFLVEKGVPYLFATNVTSETRNQLVDGLQRIDLNIPQDDILTCVEACIDYLKAEKLENIYLISDNEDLRVIFDNEFTLLRSYDPKGPEAHAIVVALDRIFDDYTKRCATTFAKMHGARIVALNMNPIRIERDGEIEMFSWNVGTYAGAFAFAAGTGVYNVGKPAREFFGLAHSRLVSKNPELEDVDISKFLVIGDDPQADLKGGMEAGMRTAFFPSNKYFSWPDIRDIGFKPDITVKKRLDELIPYFIIPDKKKK